MKKLIVIIQLGSSLFINEANIVGVGKSTRFDGKDCKTLIYVGYDNKSSFCSDWQMDKVILAILNTGL